MRSAPPVRPDGLAHRDQRAEHHQDRPFDRRRRPRAASARRAAPSATAAPKNAIATGSTPTAVEHHRRGRGSRAARARGARCRAGSRARASGRHPSSRSLSGQRAQVALQHDDVAGVEPDVAQPLGEALAAAADGEQVDAEALVQREPRGGLPISSELGADHRLDRRRSRRSASRSSVARSSPSSSSFARWRPPRRAPSGSPSRSTMSSSRSTASGQRRVASRPVADDRVDLHVVARALAQSATRLADDAGVRGPRAPRSRNPGCRAPRRIVRRALAALRQQPVAEGQERDAQQRRGRAPPA